MIAIAKLEHLRSKGLAGCRTARELRKLCTPRASAYGDERLDVTMLLLQIDKRRKAAFCLVDVFIQIIPFIKQL